MANRNSANRKSTKPEPAPKTAAQRQANQPKRQRGSLKEYFKGVRLEMKKVVWPTKSELWSYTGVVIAMSVFFAVAFWAIDSGVLAALKGLLGITM
jgi:preprotein translocase subunit SecE